MLLNTIKTITLVILLSGGGSLTVAAQSTPGTGSFEMAVYPAKEPLKLWFVLVKPATTKLTKIELVNDQNKVFYVGGISRKEQRISQLFDLSEVADGTYKIRLTTGTEVIEKAFQVKTPELREQVTRRALIFTPNNKVAARGI